MSAPPGTRVSTHPTRGRSLVASRPFHAGELIATFSHPLLALPDGPSMRTTCNFCLRVGSGPSGGPLLACAGCKATVYCDAACQRAHWKAVHKAECKMFARVRANAGRDWLPTPTRAVAQVLLLLKAGDKAARAAFGEGGTLEGNVEAFRRDEAVWGDYELQAMAAVVYGGLLESEEMLATARAVLCKIQTNAFNRLDPDTGMAGIFLDAGLAMINHSCVPNAFIGFDKRTAMLRAERNIAEGDEIEISYIDNMLPKSVRQEGLRLYHFQCECPRCKNDLDVYHVCAASPAIPLNTFSLRPDLSWLRDPSINRSKASSAVIETVYKTCNAPSLSDGGEVATKRRWKVCKTLADARMWAVEPLPATLLQATTLCQQSEETWVYALPLSCFLATECDPFKYVAPFMPWRIKGVMMIAMLFSETARVTAAGELAKHCSHKKLVEILEKTDQVSVCEAMLRLVVHYAAIGASESWEVAVKAREMLDEVSKLEGRSKQSSVLAAWARNPEDAQAGALFHEVILQPIDELAALAVEIMDDELWSPAGKAIVKR